MPYVALQAKRNQSSNRILANEGPQHRAYQYYVPVCLSVPPTKQFSEAQVVTVQWFVCLSVAMTTSQGNGLYSIIINAWFNCVTRVKETTI